MYDHFHYHPQPQDSWSNPFQGGEDDGGPSLEAIPKEAPSIDGPITRSKAKELQGKLTSFIAHFNIISDTLERVDEIDKERPLLQLKMETTAPDSASNSADSSRAFSPDQ